MSGFTHKDSTAYSKMALFFLFIKPPMQTAIERRHLSNITCAQIYMMEELWNPTFLEMLKII